MSTTNSSGVRVRLLFLAIIPFFTEPVFEGIDGNVYYDRNDDTIFLL
jgi:hypothetical protein